MDSLLQPHTGLIVWTICTFLGLVLILGKFAWKPILGGINSREEKIKNDLDRAEKSQKEAEQLRVKFESQLAEAQKSIQDMMNQARSDAEKSRAQLLETTRQEADKLLEKGKKDLQGETEKLKADLQKEVASISVSIAEKILHRSVDQKVQAQVLEESLKSLQGVGR